MNPLDKEVAEFMKSHDFKPTIWDKSGIVDVWDKGSTHNGDFMSITRVEATFFYAAQRKAELKTEIKIHDEYWHSQKCVEKNGIGPVALAHKEATELQLRELEAQLNQSKLEKGYKDE